MEDFIKIYKNALSNDVCDYIIKMIDNNPDLTHEGRTVNGVDNKHKLSTDLNLLKLQNKDKYIDTKVLPSIKNIVEKSLFEYNREHPTFDIKFNTDPTDPLFNEEEFKEKMEKYTVIDPNSLLCKKYTKNNGFFNWHMDNGVGCWLATSRILVLMFYLNDVEEGGETEFYYQEISIKPKKGSLVIFPTTWTHLHRGRMPISNDKYICNLWLLRRNPIIDEMADNLMFKDHFMNKNN